MFRSPLMLAGLLACSIVFAQTPPVEKNVYGMPVRTTTGQPINYSHEQLQSFATTMTSGFQKTAATKQAALLAVKNPLSYLEHGQINTYLDNIGIRGMVAVDLDRDGTQELILGNFNSWGIQRYDAAKKDYVLSWKSKNYGDSHEQNLASLNVFPEPTTGDVRVLVGLVDGTLNVYNGLTRQLIGAHKPATTAIMSILQADADNDSKMDLVLLTPSETLLLDPVSYTLKRRLNNPGEETTLVIADVDADPGFELVYGSGKVINQTEANSALVWNAGENAFKGHLAAADLNGDGKSEIVAANWSLINIFDAQTKATVRSHTTSHDIGRLLLKDLDGDQRPEILYGDGQWGDIYALDGVTGNKIWNIKNPEHGVQALAVADLNADNKQDLIWTAGGTSSGEDHLYIADIDTLTLTWQSVDETPPFDALAFGDIDGDSKPEFLYASSKTNNGYGGGMLHVLDAETHQEKWRSEKNALGMNWHGVAAISIGDVDGDKNTDIVVGASSTHDGSIIVIDGKTKAMKTFDVEGSGYPASSLQLLDTDGDGILDILLGGKTVHTGSKGQHLRVVDGRNGAIKWQSAVLNGNYWGAISQIADGELTGGGATDIALNAGVLAVINGDTKQVAQSPETDYVSMVLNDSRKTGKLDFIAATADGKIYRVDTSTFERELLNDRCKAGVKSLTSLSDGKVLYLCGKQIVQYNTLERQVEWVSEPLGYDISGNNKLLFAHVGEQPVLWVGGDRVTTMMGSEQGVEMPVALSASLSTHWRTPLKAMLQGQAASTGKALGFIATRNPAKGLLTVDGASGEFEYQPNGFFVGEDSFEFVTTQGFLESKQTAKVTITLTNNAPVAKAADLSSHWRSALTGTLSGSDADNDPLIFELLDKPVKGEVILTHPETGEFSYSPTSAGVFTDRFSFKVSDGVAEAEAVVNVVITNSVPTVSSESIKINQDGKVQGQVKAQDADGDLLSYALVKSPELGDVSFDTTTGAYSYTAKAGATGQDSFQVKTNDGVSDSAVATISIKLAEPPVVTPTPAPAPSSGGGGSTALWLLALLGLAGLRRAY